LAADAGLLLLPLLVLSSFNEKATDELQISVSEIIVSCSIR
jgi:hypothetical protein